MGDDSSGSDSVQCHTDMDTCCSGTQGSGASWRLVFTMMELLAAIEPVSTDMLQLLLVL